ncbi:hypothetical protein JTB14_010538 [Gonioctena quinquepunctata]|nr:hypothetical protein JTB14_010538 [Gonioctena quinquepunctata]
MVYARVFGPRDGRKRLIAPKERMTPNDARRRRSALWGASRGGDIDRAGARMRRRQRASVERETAGRASARAGRIVTISTTPHTPLQVKMAALRRDVTSAKASVARPVS